MTNHLASLEKAIEYIEQHLSEDISVKDVANEAGYSLYHLIRIFASLTGEPVGSYIQKRRLSNAAKMLLHSNMRVIDIAIESGFSSSEAFSRAFKAVYGASPAVYRKDGVDLYIGTKPSLDKETLRHLSNGITVKPSFIEIDSILIAGIRGETTLFQNTLPKLWEKFNLIRKDIPTFQGARGFGICETDRTETALTKDGDIMFSEMVGIEIDKLDPLLDEVAIKTIEGGRYAVFTHKGTIETLLKTYEYIWGSWFLFTKEEIDDRKDLEIYDERFLGPDNPQSQIDIYIPIK